MLGVLVAAAPIRAQRGERDFLEEAADDLHAYAQACFDAGYPKRAREVWLEVIWEYLPDHEATRAALGFVRVGTSWAPDPAFEYPLREQPNAAAARTLQAKWDKLCKELGDGHRDLAERLAAAGEHAGARTHYERVLRFLPEDPAAAAARDLRNFEGVLGTEIELAILERSRRIQRTVEAELAREAEVAALPPSARHVLLDAARVDYRGVQSEHFTVWGDFDEEILVSAARFAERALAFCAALLVGDDRFAWPAGGRHGLAFFRGKPKWVEIVRANAERFRPGELEFIVQHATITAMGTGPNRLRVAGLEGRAEVEDFAVREVAQVYSDLDTDAMHEGIGHAIVGLFFGRNLIFTVGQERPGGRTTSGAERRDARFQLPDLSVWQDLAAESAWERSDMPAARLPLLSAAAFPNEGRIKAWSICDYLLRREPRLLLELDRTKAAGAAHERAVAEQFEQAAGIALARLDADWRAFWTRDTPVMRAIRERRTPLESVSKQAPAFLEAFNDVRRALAGRFRTEPVGWVAEYSSLCKDHALYLAANTSARGPVAEHTQELGKRGASTAGRDFARTALVATRAHRPRDEIESWLRWPGYRDALIHESLESVGLYVEGKIAVLDVTRGIARRPQIRHYPAGNQKDVEVEVAVAELGPDVEALLERHGRKRQRTIGYPLSLHFYTPANLPEAATLRCTVRRGADELAGVVQVADAGTSRRTSAPGLVVFYPFEPLPRGSQLSVRWQYALTDGTPRTMEFSFRTR